MTQHDKAEMELPTDTRDETPHPLADYPALSRLHLTGEDLA